MRTIQASLRQGLLRPLRRMGLQVAQHWPWPVCAEIRNGHSLYVDLRSTVSRGLFMTGEFDPAIFEAFRRRLKPGDVFVDIGANVGYYSLLALDLVERSGAVHAFEIDARPLRCLKKTIAARRLNNLHLHELAVSDEDGEATLIAGSECGHSCVAKGVAGPSVPTITLDSWRQRNRVEKIAAVKIDVEGGELRVLRGAVETLRRDRPLIVCEAEEAHLRRMNTTVAELIHCLNSAGYRTCGLEGVWTPTIVAE